MQWVAHQRYEAARLQLLMAKPNESVTSIAMSYEFHSPSRFAAGYKLRFGELPSLTLAKSRNG